MEALGREQCENTTGILPQPDNEFEKCFIIKPEKGKWSESKHRRSLYSLSGGRKRHDSQTLNIKIWAETGHLCGLGISKYLESTMSMEFK